MSSGSAPASPPAGRRVRAVIALGANLGERETTLRRAVADLDALSGAWVVAASLPVSSVALTDHGWDETRPGYLNGVVLVDTVLAPDELLTELHRIEAAHGRVRHEHWGDRTLDLDLIVHGDAVLATERLTLPHPRAAERVFVVEPWLQVDPAAALPGAGPIAGVLVALLDEGHQPTVPVAGAAPLDADLGTRAIRAQPAERAQPAARSGDVA